MRKDTALATLSVCTAIIAAGALVANAGPLDPPAGPVASTYKTLHEVEPRTPIAQDDIPLTITIPGSYYLTEDLHAVGFGNDMITIASDDVSLDLRGFTIVGSSEVAQADDGIAIPFDTTNVSIANGAIRACIGSGINAVAATAGEYRNLRLQGNVGHGMRVGASSIVESCVATGNGDRGIYVTESVVTGCIAQDNDSVGIQIGDRSRAFNCKSTGNLQGFIASSGSTVEQCIATDNTANGIVAGNYATIRLNHCSQNDGSGIVVQDLTSFAHVDSNVCQLNGLHGIIIENDANSVSMVRNRSIANGGAEYSFSGGDVGTISNDPAGAGAWDNLQ